MSLFNKNHVATTDAAIEQAGGGGGQTWRTAAERISPAAVMKSIGQSLSDVDISIAEIARTVAERPKVEQIPAAFDPPLAEPYLIFEKTYDGAYSIRFDLKTTDSDRAFEALEAIQKIIIANKMESK